MCNTFLCTLGLSRGLKYKLILLNNRDEILDRKTSAAHWEHGFLAGRDEQETERGTWLGMNKSGKIGNTLSITEPEHTKKQRPTAPTRGTIVTNFLTGPRSGPEFCEHFRTEASRYNGFQFLAFERNERDTYDVTSLTNQLVTEIKPCKWKEGIYCFGNSPHDKPLKKVEYGERIFRQFIETLPTGASEQHILDGLMKIAKDTTEHFPDEQLAEQTGRQDESYNRHLSSIYVRFPPQIRYGTRCHTIILVDKDNKVYFREERMQEPASIEEDKWDTSEFRFTLE